MEGEPTASSTGGAVKKRLPRWLPLVASLALAASMFMPSTQVEGLPGISVFTHIELFLNVGSAGGELGALVSGFGMAFYGVYAALVVLCVLFALVKKPVPLIVFTVLSAGGFVTLSTAMGVFNILGEGGDNVSVGAGFYVGAVSLLVLLLSAIRLLAAKMRLKRRK